MGFRWKIAQYLERRWWKNYLSKKDPKQYLAWKRAYWHQFLKDVESAAPKDQRVLDAGCGPAGIFTILEGNEVIAIDPLLSSYEEFSAFRPEEAPWTQFEQSLLEGFSALNFNIIYCTNAINHVRDLSRGFTKLLDLLEPGGELFVSTDCHKFSLFKHLFRFTQLDVLHPHQFDEQEYGEQILEAGGAIEKSFILGGDLFFRYVVFKVRKPE